MRALLLSALLLAVGSPAAAQSVPITTASEAARAHFEAGRVYDANLELDAARASFDAALAVDPDFALALLARARLAPAAERASYLDRAAASEAALSDGERMMIAAYAAYVNDGDVERELALLDEVAKAYPNDPYPHEARGWRLYNEERYDEARAAAQAALTADPGFAAAYNMLGYIALADEAYDQAEAAFKDYVRLAPDRPNPYDSLGEFYMTMGRLEEAATQFELALARDPDFAIAQDNLARTHIERSNERFGAFLENGDADGMASLYTPNAILMPTGSDTVQGTEEIKAYWQRGFDVGVARSDLRTIEVIARDDLAVERGQYGVQLTDGTVLDQGKYIIVWAHGPDGWKRSRDIWNTSLSAEPVEADSD